MVWSTAFMPSFELPEAEAGSTSALERLKTWWWLICLVAFLAGSATSGLYKFSVYYLAEQSSVATLQSMIANAAQLVTRLEGMDTHFAKIDGVLADQKYTNQSRDAERADIIDHLRAIEAGASAIREQVVGMHEQLATQNERIRWLLDPKGAKGSGK